MIIIHLQFPCTGTPLDISPHESPYTITPRHTPHRALQSCNWQVPFVQLVESIRQPGMNERRVIAAYDYQATSPDELSFKRGDVIVVTGKEDANWLRGRLREKEGVFPYNYVQWVLRFFPYVQFDESYRANVFSSTVCVRACVSVSVCERVSACVSVRALLYCVIFVHEKYFLMFIIVHSNKLLS